MPLSVLWDGTELNNGSWSSVKALPQDWYTLPASALDSLETPYGPPLFVRRRLGPRQFVLTVEVLGTGSTWEANRRKLLALLTPNPAENTAHQLTISEDSLPEAQTAWVTVERVESLGGPFLTVSLVAHDPRKYGANVLLAAFNHNSPASDNFNRADNASSLGTGWTAVSGTWGIISNQAYESGGSTSVKIAVNNTAAASADMQVGAHIVWQAGGPGLVVRYTDASNYIRCRMTSADLILEQVVTGTVTEIGRYAGLNPTAGYTYTVILRAYGSTAEVSVDGTVRIRAATSLTSGSKGGLFMDGTATTANRWDNWYLNNIAMTISNTGDMAIQPRIFVDPAGLTQLRIMPVVVVNGLTKALTGYWLTASFNHASEVSAGNSRADGYDIEVLVDGQIVPFGVANPNTASTKVWWKMDMPPRVQATLRAAITASQATPFTVLVNTTRSFPRSGFVLIDSEVFAVQVVDSHQLLVTGRGMWGSSQAAHGEGTAVLVVPRQVLIRWGGPNMTRTSASWTFPALDTTNSTNSTWTWSAVSGGLAQVDKDLSWRPTQAILSKPRGQVFRGSVPSSTWESVTQTYGGAALSIGSPDEVDSDGWIFQSPVTIDRIRSVTAYTSCDPQYILAYLQYRTKNRWVTMASGPASSTYSSTESTYTQLTVTDTPTGIGASSVAWYIYQKRYRSVTPPDRIRLDSIILDLLSSEVPTVQVLPVASQHTVNLRVVRGSEAVRISWSRVGSGSLVIDCLEGQLYQYVGSANPNTSPVDPAVSDRRRVPASLTVEHQSGTWITLPSGSSTVYLLADYLGPVYAGIHGRRVYL